MRCIPLLTIPLKLRRNGSKPTIQTSATGCDGPTSARHKGLAPHRSRGQSDSTPACRRSTPVRSGCRRSLPDDSRNERGTARMKAPTELSNSMNTPCLALRPKEAAKALGIGERLLWSLTNRGEVPHVRLGRAVVYPVDLLRKFLEGQAKRRGESREQS